MRIDLMPPIPLARRWYKLWISLIVLFLATILVLSGWIYYKQMVAIQEVEAENKVIEADYKVVREIVNDEEMITSDPSYLYGERVEQLMKERIDWTEGLELIDSALPSGANLFQLQVVENELKGWAAFHSYSDAASFTEKMKLNNTVTSFSLEAVESAEVYKHLKLDPEDVKIVRFHFRFQPLIDELQGVSTEGEGE
ncbi:hypothetical protein [Mechercharimyces sp. CAU 1602]|uniref:hypothetical protein n=1 Tax=Mechercharimyces sp. CAU 1602 TaxID=2973933 RepID=UPI002161ADE7|nr:hypothetical protein [Mechercharimyces sp. CAU 1602]MCS1351439.1 hypothetical protein [Mechercharimyces sp. CAU 1602]